MPAIQRGGWGRGVGGWLAAPVVFEVGDGGGEGAQVPHPQPAVVPAAGQRVRRHGVPRCHVHVRLPGQAPQASVSIPSHIAHTTHLCMPRHRAAEFPQPQRKQTSTSSFCGCEKMKLLRLLIQCSAAVRTAHQLVRAGERAWMGGGRSTSCAVTQIWALARSRESQMRRVRSEEAEAKTVPSVGLHCRSSTLPLCALYAWLTAHRPPAAPRDPGLSPPPCGPQRPGDGIHSASQLLPSHRLCGRKLRSQVRSFGSPSMYHRSLTTPARARSSSIQRRRPSTGLSLDQAEINVLCLLPTAWLQWRGAQA